MIQSYRSLHPNHVHQLTVSVSKHYWVTKSDVLKYQNKAIEINLEKLKGSKRNHLIHYIIRDHCSGVVYSEIATSENLIPLDKFLFRAWSQKEDFIFCGIPDLLTIPKTVEKAFPEIKEKISLLGVQFPQVTSGFQSGMGDMKTIERYICYYADKPLYEVLDILNKTHLYLSKKKARVGKQTKLEFWQKYIKSIEVPPKSWLKADF
jgi:hypothetical protein